MIPASFQPSPLPEESKYKTKRKIANSLLKLKQQTEQPKKKKKIKEGMKEVEENK